MTSGYFHNADASHHHVPKGIALLFISFRHKVMEQTGELSIECEQAWCEVGQATAPAHDTLDDADGDDWLGSSTQLGVSESSTPVSPSHTPPAFRQGLHSVQELSEDAAPLSGESCRPGILYIYIAGFHISTISCLVNCKQATAHMLRTPSTLALKVPALATASSSLLPKAPPTKAHLLRARASGRSRGMKSSSSSSQQQAPGTLTLPLVNMSLASPAA